MALQSYVIEVAGEAAGIVVQERGGFRFFAASSACTSLNQHIFRNPHSAERTCRNLMELRAFPASVGERTGSGYVKPLAAAAVRFRSIAGV
jgi:hypothetical protein